MGWVLMACVLNGALYETRRAELTDDDGDGFNEDGGDCDDGDLTRFPGAVETCDGVDEDCDGVVDEDAVDVGEWFPDTDGDGFGDGSQPVTTCVAPDGYVDRQGDCADDDPTRNPGAAEEWYDGVDQDCKQDDDYDQDGDGDRSAEYGGGDCHDDDPTIASSATEGWLDVGVDNDCDGSIEDPVTVALDSVRRIDGPAAQSNLGAALLVLPAGWFGPGPSLLAAAPRFENFAGAVYGWSGGSLEGAPTVDAADWALEAGEYLGSALGFAGSADSPIVLVGEVTAQGSRGAVNGWVRSDVGLSVADATFRIQGGVDGLYVGGTVLSGVDLDADGVGDIVVNAILDSRVASNGGSAAVFHSAPTGIIDYDDADLQFTTTFAGASLRPIAVGDADGDGSDDLGFEFDGDPKVRASGALVLGLPSAGTLDVQLSAQAQFYYCAPRTATDLDGDGTAELIALGGIVWQVDLPVSGAVLPWEPLVASQAFEDSVANWVGSFDADLPYWDGRRAASASYAFDQERGAVALDALAWAESSNLEDAKYLVSGEQAGDLFGMGLGVIDHDGDGVSDLVVSAPAADHGASDAGSIYLIPAPR